MSQEKSSHEKLRSSMLDDLSRFRATKDEEDAIVFFADLDFQNNPFMSEEEWKMRKVCSELKKYVLTPNIFSESPKRPRKKINARIKDLEEIRKSIPYTEAGIKKFRREGDNLESIIKDIAKNPEKHEIPPFKIYKRSSEFYQIFFRAYYNTAAPSKVIECINDHLNDNLNDNLKDKNKLIEDNKELIDAVHFLLVCIEDKIVNYSVLERKIITELRKYICNHIYENNKPGKKNKLPSRFEFLKEIAGILKNRNADTNEQDEKLRKVIACWRNKTRSRKQSLLEYLYFSKMLDRLKGPASGDNEEIKMSPMSPLPDYKCDEENENMEPTASKENREPPKTPNRYLPSSSPSLQQTYNFFAQHLDDELRSKDTASKPAQDDKGKEERAPAHEISIERRRAQAFEEESKKMAIENTSRITRESDGSERKLVNSTADKSDKESIAHQPAHKKNADQASTQVEFTKTDFDTTEHKDANRKTKPRTVRIDEDYDRSLKAGFPSASASASDRPNVFDEVSPPPPRPPSPSPSPSDSSLIGKLGLCASSWGSAIAQQVSSVGDAIAKTSNAVFIPAAEAMAQRFGVEAPEEGSSEDNSASEEAGRSNRR